MKVFNVDEADISLNGDIDLSHLKTFGSYQSLSSATTDQIINQGKESNIIVVNKALLTKEIFENLPDLRLIAISATGINNVDINAAKKTNVLVSNVRGYAEDTVPQHTLALILNLATKTHLYAKDVDQGHWEKSSSFTLLRYPTFELKGKTIGIIGFGSIGYKVAKLAEAFGMHVIVTSRSEIKDPRYTNVPLDDLLQESDIVTIHCPLTEETKDLISHDELLLMKPTGYLINTSRGGIVNEVALANALNKEKIAGAGIDVLTAEPPSSGNILLQTKNIIITPHSAWSTRQARQKLIDETVVNIRSFIKGQPRNVVT